MSSLSEYADMYRNQFSEEMSRIREEERRRLREIQATRELVEREYSKSVYDILKQPSDYSKFHEWITTNVEGVEEKPPAPKKVKELEETLDGLL